LPVVRYHIPCKGTKTSAKHKINFYFFSAKYKNLVSQKTKVQNLSLSKTSLTNLILFQLSHHRLKVAKVAKVANDVSASLYMKKKSKTDIRLWMDMMMKKRREKPLRKRDIYIIYNNTYMRTYVTALATLATMATMKNLLKC